MGTSKDTQMSNAEMALFQSTLLKRGLSEQPPNGDVYYQTIDRALFNTTRIGGALRSHLEEAFNQRRGTPREVSPQVMVSIAERAVHEYAIDNLDPARYPHDFGPPNRMTVSNANHLLEKIAQQSYHDFETFQQRLEMDSLISNEPERGVGAKLLALLFPERFGTRPKFLETGCSMNFILLWLANHKWNRNYAVEVLTADKNRIHPEFNRQVNAVLAARLSIGVSLGMDIWDTYRDTAVKNWGIVCSVTPGEMMRNPNRLNDLRQLAEYDPKNVRFLQADFTDPLLMDAFPPSHTFRRKKPGEASAKVPLGVQKFDSAISATVDYMLSEEGRQILFKFKAENIKKYGMQIEQDFAWPPSDNPTHLKYAQDIYESSFLYQTMFFDPLNTEAGWQVAFTWETGRPKRMVVNEVAKIAVGSELISIKDRLMEW